MASYNYTFTSGDTVTPTKLNSARTVSEIVNADVSATAAIAGTKVAPAFGAQDITVSTANRSITNTGNFALSFGTNNAERMRISNDGNIGIGVTDAGAKLDVRAGTLRLSTNNDRTTVYGINRGDTGSTNGMASIGMFGSGANGYQGNIIFSTSGTDVFNASLTERMRIDASGNVGIGTTPGYKLDLVGDFRVGVSASANFLVNLGRTGTVESYRSAYIYGDGTGIDFVNQQNGRLNFGANNSVRLAVKPNGQVRFVPLSADPAGAETGDVYYNSSTNKLRVYNGSWVDLH
jgi:hypothetical protein